MKRKLKICYITGTRADYGLMKHTLESMRNYFDVRLLVTGMHLEKEFGYTAREIEKDNFKIIGRIKTIFPKDTGSGMAKTFGLSVQKFADVLNKNKPNILLLLGDRGESFAGAIVASHMNIPIIHISGGDQGDDGASVDDSIRHSITKFAHLHCVSTKQSAERVIKMGEEKWRVHIVGAPSIVEIKKEKLYSKAYLEKKYKLSLKNNFIVAIQHSVVTQQQDAAHQMKETLEALKELNMQTILIYPNADAGGRRMIDVIKQYEKCDFLHAYSSLPRKDYLSFLKNASAFVGNSSSGTIDTPVLKVPAVNIGIRESTREHANNKIFVGHNKAEIKKAIEKTLYDEKFIGQVKKCKNPYGNGDTDKKLIYVINKYFPLQEKQKQKLLVKKMWY